MATGNDQLSRGRRRSRILRRTQVVGLVKSRVATPDGVCIAAAHGARTLACAGLYSRHAGALQPRPNAENFTVFYGLVYAGTPGGYFFREIEKSRTMESAHWALSCQVAIWGAIKMHRRRLFHRHRKISRSGLASRLEGICQPCHAHLRE